MSTPDVETTDAPQTTDRPSLSLASDVKPTTPSTVPNPEPILKEAIGEAAAKPAREPVKISEQKKPIQLSPALPPILQKTVAIVGVKPVPTPKNASDQKKPIPLPAIQPPPPYQELDPYIAVLGETGVGKTTFISEVTGLDLDIGHDLDSCTQDVEEFVTTIGKQRVTLIDTPGFNDTRRTDSEILEILGNYITTATSRNIKLTAVIYIQRIDEPRVRGSAVQSFNLLKKLCGAGYFGNIVLVTVGWSDTGPQVERHIRNENQLRRTDIYWGEFLKLGATFQRHTGTQASALKIVDHVLTKTPKVIQFQKQLAAAGIIGKTEAGEFLIMKFAKEKEADEKKITQLNFELSESKTRNIELEKELTDVKDKLDKVTQQIVNLNTKLDERVKWVPHCRTQ